MKNGVFDRKRSIILETGRDLTRCPPSCVSSSPGGRIFLSSLSFELDRVKKQGIIAVKLRSTRRNHFLKRRVNSAREGELARLPHTRTFFNGKHVAKVAPPRDGAI